MTYLQKFNVTGDGNFPFDMLRYDCCYPTDTDSALELDSPNGEQRTLTLSRIISNKNHLPTSGRWASFGWKVEDVRVIKL